MVALAQERYVGINHTHLTELLAEREGLILSRPTVRRLLVRAGLSIFLLDTPVLGSASSVGDLKRKHRT